MVPSLLSYITLLQGILGSVEEVGSVRSPDPLVLGGLVLLLVVQLQPAGENGVMSSTGTCCFHYVTKETNTVVFSWFCRSGHLHWWCSCRPPWQHGSHEPQGPCWSGLCTSRTPLCISAAQQITQGIFHLPISCHVERELICGGRVRLTVLVMSLTFFMCCWYGVS